MNVGLIGCGKMGRALIGGALEAGMLQPAEVFVYDVHEAASQELSLEYGVTAASSLGDLITYHHCQAVLLCTKPQDVSAALVKLSENAPSEVPLIISVAAGVTLASLAQSAPPTARLIRSMPNTPALVGKAATAFAKNENVSESDVEFVTSLFQSVGEVITISETQMDAVTGLSGSGPAFAYMFIEALADGGVSCGLSREQALTLASQTVLGAATMVRETGQHPAVLKDMVTSPGGTTIAGVSMLEEEGLRNAVIQAVKTATARSCELGLS